MGFIEGVSSILITISMFFGTWGIDYAEMGAFRYEAEAQESMMVSFYDENICRMDMSGESYEGMWYFTKDEQTGKAMFPGMETVYEIEIVKDESDKPLLRLTDADDGSTVFYFGFMEENGK